MPMEDRAGFPVHWTTMGAEGSAPTLALHCALAHSGAWQAVVQALGDRLSVVAPDLPGHGRSADWDQRCDFHDQATEIGESFLEDGITLLGHSFGATVALRLAARHPGRVRRLILIEPVLFAAARETAPEVFAARRAAGRPMQDALARGDTETAARLFTGTWGAGRSWDEMGARSRALLQKQIRIIQETEQALAFDSRNILRPGALERCTMPVLLIRGGRSEPIIAHIQAALLRRLATAREEVVAEAGHMAPITHAGAVAERIAPFLDAT